MTGADTVLMTCLLLERPTTNPLGDLLHVQISMLSDWIFTDDILQNTPSRKDGISLEQEKLYRFRTAWFIEELGREMLISRTIVSMAIAYFQRFYLFQSFKQHNRFVRHLFHS